MSEGKPAATPEPRKGDGFVGRLRQRISKRRKAVALGLAVYVLLALKWYPASMEGQRCFHGPLRLLFSGLTEEFYSPHHVAVCERSIWPIFLALPLLALFYLFFLYAAVPACRFAWKQLREAFTCNADARQICLRVLFLLVVLNMLWLPANRAWGQRPSTLNHIIDYGLLPLTLLVLALYLGAGNAISILAHFFNPWLWSPGGAFTGGFHLHSYSYSYQGLLIEALRFAILVLAAGMVVGLLSRGCRRFPRAAAVIIALLCVSLLVFAVIGIASPRTLR